jgi:hypothetical protein
MGSGIRRGGEILAVFSSRPITGPFLQMASNLKIDQQANAVPENVSVDIVM